MCGITGVVDVSSGVSISREAFIRMNSLIRHRGPDGDGYHFEDRLYLAMTRLSIIDLSGGDQPIYNENRSVVVVCNGEIYNYKELRQELLSLGHKFRTQSDVEVLVHLYEQYGMLATLKRINGMFSFALWDKSKGELFIARDRLGKKPLYYTLCGGGLVFGSEIKSILAHPLVMRAVDYTAMMNLLTFNYIPGTKTMFENISKVRPGHYIHINDRHISESCYWSLSDTEPQQDTTEARAVEELESIFSDSVNIRLRSDVPVGAFLSGGIDSSTVVSYMSKYSAGFKTFSIGFQEQSYNELPFARLISKLYGTSQVDDVVKSDSLNLLPQVLWHTDNPHGDVSFLPMLHLSTLTARHVKVVLTGDGADELFAGYDKYEQIDSLPGSDMEKWMAYHDNTSVFNSGQKRSITNESLLKLDDSSEMLAGFYANSVSGDLLNTILLFDTCCLLEGNNLVKPERMAMAVGLETRSPFLDYRLVEFITSLPSCYKYRSGIKKYLLKKLIRQNVPDLIIDRPKQMFTVPIGLWIKNELQPLFRAVLLSQTFGERGYFDMKVVEAMLNDHVIGVRNYTRQLRLLFIIELWHRMFIDDHSLQCPTAESVFGEALSSLA